MTTKYIYAILTICFTAGVARAEDKKVLKDKKEKTSYSMGYNIGSAWKRQGIEGSDVDLDVLVSALKDVMEGKESIVTDQENRELLTAFQADLRTRRDEKRKQLGEKNKVESEKFLSENKAKPGVQTLPSGLQYKVLTQGTGPKPTTNDTVSVNYRGTLTDGTEFDSSYKRGQPANFKVTGVIPGWTEALLLMPVGSKWQLVIPSDLAYRDRGQGALIGPNATLVFEVELVSIQPAEKPATIAAPQQPVTSDIIKVPSAEELKKGAKIEIIKPEQLEQEKLKEQERLKKEAEKK
ncbi:MAG: FKBP-type peptidyl-prolyl cis-trans isomerase [Verrucomicrobiota bacterium]